MLSKIAHPVQVYGTCVLHSMGDAPANRDDSIEFGLGSLRGHAGPMPALRYVFHSQYAKEQIVNTGGVGIVKFLDDRSRVVRKGGFPSVACQSPNCSLILFISQRLPDTFYDFFRELSRFSAIVQHGVEGVRGGIFKVCLPASEQKNNGALVENFRTPTPSGAFASQLPVNLKKASDTFHVTEKFSIRWSSRWFSHLETFLSISYAKQRAATVCVQVRVHVDGGSAAEAYARSRLRFHGRRRDIGKCRATEPVCSAL
jgi:hypothetical protein